MKLKNVMLLLGAAVLCAAAVWARNMAEYTSRNVENLGAFSALDVRGDAEVDFVQRADASVTLSGRDKLVNAVQVRVEANTLVISFAEPMFGKDKDKLHILVTAPEVTAVTVSQNGEVDVRGALQADALTLTASQNGDISIDNLDVQAFSVAASGRAEVDVNRLAAKSVRAAASNHAEIELGGMAREVYLENNGSGDIDAGSLRAFSVKAVVNGSGDVEVFATDTLDASAMGRGKIEYKGVPARINPVGNTRKIVQDL